MGTPLLDLGGHAETKTVMIDGVTYQVGGTLAHADTMKKPDFSGWATVTGVKCTDGRTILKDAFKHQDKTTVPLVWKHGHDDMESILGHVELEHHDTGVRANGFFNTTDSGKRGKVLVDNEDIKALSIYATGLAETAGNVAHGNIMEVSLVPAGANPGALIDNIELKHSADGEWKTLADEAIIYTGTTLVHGDAAGTVTPPKVATTEPPKKDEDDEEGKTVEEVYATFNEEQKAVASHMVAKALEGVKHDGTNPGDGSSLEHHIDDNKKGQEIMTRNVFEQNGGTLVHQGTPGGTTTINGELKHVITDADKQAIVADALAKNSAQKALQDYALAHGINDIQLLFPDAKLVSNTPEWDKRRTEWVSRVLGGTRHTPFAKIKSLVADITHDEARARGYITGNFKREEWIKLAQRTTGPATIYKKQKMDRDNVIDITDFDVVAWIQGEMRLMLEEEVARSILIGDGRDIGDPDKIKDPEGAPSGDGIRSILLENELYAATINVNIDDANSDGQEVVEQVMYGMELYKGSGSPTFFTTQRNLTWMLLSKDANGRRYYNNVSELAAAMGVSAIVPVEVMSEITDLLGIIVNLSDYNIGTNRGGEITSFEDFDLNYNQMLYLLETRLSGALVKIRSALVVKKVDAILAEPEKPSFNQATGAVTINDTDGVVYKDGNATVTSASNINVAQGASKTITAFPAAGFYFADNINDEFTFQRPAANP